MTVTNSQAFKKLHGKSTKESLSMVEVAKLSGMPIGALMEVYERGMGSYFTNPESVRKSVSSPQEWAFARVYSFVMRRKSTFGGADAYIAKKYNIA
jgi:hypothetical protein